MFNATGCAITKRIEVCQPSPLFIGGEDGKARVFRPTYYTIFGRLEEAVMEADLVWLHKPGFFHAASC